MKGTRPPCTAYGPTPDCVARCRDPPPIRNYTADKHFGNSAYVVHGVERMQLELLTHGPLECSVRVYEDYWQYRSGVYRHVSGKLISSHAMKVRMWRLGLGGWDWLEAFNPIIV